MKAFSLIELSIVLVILGLLTGGILAGRSLVHAAELRTITSDFTRFKTAGLAFRDKYFGLPGDLTNATSFWGMDVGGCPGTNVTTTAPGTATCDGNGNGQITYGTATTSTEVYRAWQHLANAGLIEGSFTGVSNNASAGTAYASTTAPNVPASRLNKAMWLPIYLGSKNITDTAFFDGSYGNVFAFGTAITVTASAISPEDAWNIDSKMDDGKPGTGIATTYKQAATANSSTGCSDTDYTTTSSIAASSSYLLSNPNIICAFLFKTGF